MQQVTMEDFERKLTETDCYLQLLISQNCQLEAELEAGSAEAEQLQPLVSKLSAVIKYERSHFVSASISDVLCAG